MARGFEQRRLTIVLLVLATVCGAVLRLAFLDSQSLWLDESFTRRIVELSSLTDSWDGVIATESTPPFYYLVVWSWVKLIGNDGEAALRVVSALAGIASIPVAFFALRRLVGRDVALATAAMVAASPFLAWYALDARSYSLFLFLSLLSIWAFSAIMEGPTRTRWLMWALAAVACAWTHYFAFFLVLAELCVILGLRPQSRRAAVLWGFVTALGAAPAWFVLSAQGGGTGRTDWIGDLSLQHRLEQLVRQFPAGPEVPFAALEWAALLIVIVAFAIGVLTVLAPGRTNRQHSLRDRAVSDGPLALLMLAAIGVGAPLLLALTAIDDHLLARNVIAVWPAFAGIAAIALVRCKAIGLVALMVIGVATIAITQTDWRYGKPDWRGAVSEYKAQDPKGPLIVYPAAALPTARAYLDAADVGSPTLANEVWTIAEPARQGTRSLSPVAGVPAEGTLGSGFRPAGSFQHAGFVISRFVAHAPVLVDPALVIARPIEGKTPAIVEPAD